MDSSSNARTILFVPAAEQAAADAARLENLSLTDVHNRAIQLYARLLKYKHDGNTLLLAAPDGHILGELEFS